MITIVLAQPALAQSAEPTVQELQKEVRQRDALILNLARRVALLEKQVNKRSSTSASARQAVTPAIAVAPASGALPAENVSFGPEQPPRHQPRRPLHRRRQRRRGPPGP